MVVRSLAAAVVALLLASASLYLPLQESQSRNRELSGLNASLQSRIDSLNSQIASLDSQVSSLNSQLDEQPQLVKQLRDLDLQVLDLESELLKAQGDLNASFPMLSFLQNQTLQYFYPVSYCDSNGLLGCADDLLPYVQRDPGFTEAEAGRNYTYLTSSVDGGESFAIYFLPPLDARGLGIYVAIRMIGPDPSHGLGYFSLVNMTTAVFPMLTPGMSAQMRPE